MNLLEIDWKKHSKQWIALIASVVGLVILYLWQPITDYFITGLYDENITVKSEIDSIYNINELPTIIIRTRISNRGNVPFKIDYESKDQEITIYKIKKEKNGVWYDFSKSEKITSKKLFNTDQQNIEIAPSAFIEKNNMISLEEGLYLIKLNVNGKNGYHYEEEEVYDNRNNLKDKK